MAEPGSECIIKNLTKCISLNGQVCLVIRFVDEKKRFEVELCDIDRNPVLIRPQNLEPMLMDHYFLVRDQFNEYPLNCFQLSQLLIPDNLVQQVRCLSDMRQRIHGIEKTDMLWIRIILPQLGHAMVLYVIRVANGKIFGRIFQAYANEYTAKKYLKHVQWLGLQELDLFFDKLHKLQNCVKGIASCMYRNLGAKRAQEVYDVGRKGCWFHAEDGCLYNDHPKREEVVIKLPKDCQKYASQFINLSSELFLFWSTFAIWRMFLLNFKGDAMEHLRVSVGDVCFDRFNILTDAYKAHPFLCYYGAMERSRKESTV